MDINDFTPEQFGKVIEELTENVKRATALRIMVATEGWSILLTTFEELREKQLKELRNQIPGDEKAILAAHAVWAATEHTLDQIVSGVNLAIRQGAESEALLNEAGKPREQEDWS